MGVQSGRVCGVEYHLESLNLGGELDIGEDGVGLDDKV